MESFAKTDNERRPHIEHLHTTGRRFQVVAAMNRGCLEVASLPMLTHIHPFPGSDEDLDQLRTAGNLQPCLEWDSNGAYGLAPVLPLREAFSSRQGGALGGICFRDEPLLRNYTFKLKKKLKQRQCQKASNRKV